MTSRHSRIAPMLILLAALCVQDCGDDRAPLRLALETEHFVVLTEEGVPDTCPLLGEWLEGYYQEFESYLGLRRATTRKLTYEIFNRTDAARSACNGAAIGCYAPESDTIVTVLMLHTANLKTRADQRDARSSCDTAGVLALSRDGTRPQRHEIKRHRQSQIES